MIQLVCMSENYYQCDEIVLKVCSTIRVSNQFFGKREENIDCELETLEVIVLE